MTDGAGRAWIGRRLTVQSWFYLVLALMMLVVVIGTAVGASLLDRTAQVTDQLLGHVQPAQTEAYRLQATLVNQETGIRGYAIAADRQFLEPYTQGKRDETRVAARLRSLVADRPRLLADLDAVQQGAANWRDTYAEPLAASVTPGRPRTIDQNTTDRGKEKFDHLRALWTQQNRDLTQALRDGQEKLAHERTVRNAVLSGMVVLFLLTGLTLAILVRLLVTRPLEALREASRQVADGDFDHVIRGGGPADLAAVAADVEGMRQQIVAELAASRSQRDILTRQAADLDAQAVELRRSNAELEQFAYVASHDLQEPLRKVASFCQLLEKRYGDQLDERGQQYIDFAVDGAKRMQVLINDLLTFSRVGRVNDTQVPVDLDQTLDQAMTNLTAAVEESGARVDRPDTLPEIVGDPTLLAMLWQNLIGNALKFRHTDRAPHVTIICAVDPDRPDTWLVWVTDNGIGIPAEFAEKVFVIFQRLHGRDAYGGTGIGLALCKKIVEYHGGTIWLDTGRTEGTRFCFTLPFATVPVIASAPRTEKKALT
ncbi:sensor histidine kinase [Streptomyces pseudovenezuelae]|uniref:histidine kinase n=1 Tax=Streptomyces pseudovenezuelae TaxID=67350 RepID=A0ABT6LRI0_9ACTN|nr:sensor histidine kinase [Streptomyces pseudovenezuelae]MDH6218940.1 signal transduction histidine kinase [Streptomyces pseudovenezuelae]